MNKQDNVTTPRQGMRERLQSRYADRQFNTDEDYDNAFDEMSSSHDELQKYKDDSVKNSQIIADAMEADEDFAAVMNEMMSGTDFKVALAKYISPEDLVVLKEDANYPAYEDAMRERVSRLEAKRSRAAEVDAAMQQFNEFLEENFGDDPQGKEDFINMVRSFAMGNFTKDHLHTLNRGRSYDGDIAKAKETAEMKGKNAAITAPKKATAGDGMPDLGSAAATPEEDESQGSGITGDLKGFLQEKKKARL